MNRAQSLVELENKVCIITGSTSGIGKAIAKELGDLGAKVVVNADLSKELSRRPMSCAATGSVA